MNDDKPARNTQRRGRPMSPSASFLVRCWLEPREAEGAQPAVRLTVRNLQTGEEQHLSDPRQLGERVLRHLEGAGAEVQEMPESGREHG
jgi:hypothetical protein